MHVFRKNLAFFIEIGNVFVCKLSISDLMLESESGVGGDGSPEGSIGKERLDTCIHMYVCRWGRW